MDKHRSKKGRAGTRVTQRHKTKNPAGGGGAFLSDRHPAVVAYRGRPLPIARRCTNALTPFQFRRREDGVRSSSRDGSIRQCRSDLDRNVLGSRRAVDDQVGGGSASLGDARIHPPQHRIVLHVARELRDQVGRGGG